MGTLYSNFVLENKLESILTTKLDLMNYLTPDYSLQAAPGMIKKVHVYKPTGSVEDLTVGNGNTTSIDAGFIEKAYTVGVTQGRFPYYDENAMTDPAYVDAGVKGLAEIMANDLTTKAIKEFGHAILSKTTTNYALADIIDAMAKYPYEEEAGLFMLVGLKAKAAIRKQLKDELKYVEDFARKGYIGSIMGMPVYESKAVADDCAFIATREAVTAFIKKGVESEQERDANTRKTTVYLRKCMVVALTDATRVIMMGPAQTTTVTCVADKSDATITGAADTGAVVSAFQADGTFIGSATASSNAYSISASAVASGWTAGTSKVYVVVEEAGKANEYKEATVQA